MCSVGSDPIGPRTARSPNATRSSAQRPLREHEITPDEAKELLVEGRSPLIEDFVSKRGNKFVAHLVLSAKKDKAEFEFAPR
jgi:DNA topoisomerase-3